MCVDVRHMNSSTKFNLLSEGFLKVKHSLQGGKVPLGCFLPGLLLDIINDEHW